MSLAHHIAVVLNTTAGPNPQPDQVTASGQTANQAVETNSTAADIASSLGPMGVFLLLLMAAFFLYVVSLSLHPNAKCNRCKGAGRHHGGIFSYAQRPCTSCKGRGVHPRIGRRILFKSP
ncbi:hypothetical protein HPO96_06655 [Kribbella sandramycini]|uniref:Uncharacterized protein n=1 Tax=Kribbella sandramycini TaxID=60450 RepID=A0A7Y4NXI2_9ACTN|nr:hypothetical protein [Kribbella sandramycini]MBB6567475.1 hypothetical protein [Kribbella sandramycini]NOL39917.1 hypothetical protein [Kribbella sandramycini]